MNPASDDATSKSGFPPILGTAPRVLVLGTLPSRLSLEKRQYYGHPRNGFWPIMQALVGARGSYAERCATLVHHGIAVWDVLAQSVRPGSMDADIDIDSAYPNPLDDFIQATGSLLLVCFNGKTAEGLFDRLVGRDTVRGTVRFEALPSTSPAYAAMSLEEKTRRWGRALSAAIPAVAERLPQNDRGEKR
ncbi:MAG: DNA-deoxyinosine glycosylase [Woeseiaceae bacterium]|jgi:hypoxanthine-DNA glycosylase|nr:DNA-deoxyinosine glycosylase [Woeseiaceae bacterium]